MKQLLVKNFWLKILALSLAIIAWFYVVGELNKGTPEEKAFFGLLLPYKLEAKEVPIKLTLIGKPLTGYRILNESISIKPSNCLIIAPKNLLKGITYVATEDIDIGEFTKSVVKQVKIKPMGEGIVFKKDFTATVAIPIEKIEEAAQVQK